MHLMLFSRSLILRVFGKKSFSCSLASHKWLRGAILTDKQLSGPPKDLAAVGGVYKNSRFTVLLLRADFQLAELEIERGRPIKIGSGR